jgi:signal transduction histidine kinase
MSGNAPSAAFAAAGNVTVSHATLADPWRKPWNWVVLGLLHAVFTFAVWMLVTGFDWWRLTRSNGWEPAGIVGFSLLLHLAYAQLQRRLSADPRLGQAILWAVALCMSGVLFGALVATVFPQWVFEYGAGKKIHAINGVLLASLFGILFFLIWLVLADLRLTALEPLRERRLRGFDDANTEIEFGTAPSPGLAGWFSRVKTWMTWRLPTRAGSTLLEPFTWPRTIVRGYMDSIFMSLLSGLALSIAVSAGAFGPKEIAAQQFEAAANAYPDWYSWVGTPLLLSAGVIALAICRSFASWVNHSVTGAVLIVWIAHLSLIGLMRFLVPPPPFMAILDTVTWGLSLAFALRTTVMINQRAAAIDTAQRIEQDRLAAKAEAQRAQAISDLRALQAQIEPHFLYNTLASVQLLIRHDAERADAMTGHLIDYLRARLPLMRQASTNLSSEFELIKSYMQIMKIRMGERLRPSFDLPEDCFGVQLPPLVVMTVVENAIKHGLEPKRGGGEVTVSAQRLDAGWVRVRVADTGVGFGGAAGTSGTGVGITNVQERLRLSYAGKTDANGQSARLELSHNEATGVIADIIIPG